jgi:HTH-type transcriptional regulator / antitoxin HigA
MPNIAEMSGNNDILSMIDETLSNHSSRQVIEILRIHSEESCERASKILEYLLLNTPDTPDNPYGSLIELLSILIEAYERTQHPLPNSNPIEIVKFLMDQHGLKQEDLPEIGPQSRVSDFLHGKRELSKAQIKRLSERFNISPALLIG